MFIETIIIGTIIGISIGILIDYWDKREYYHNLKRNKKVLGIK